jgi:head-tail adaptor
LAALRYVKSGEGRGGEVAAGDLRHRVTIRQNVGTAGTYGNTTADFDSSGSLVATVPAQVLSVGGNEVAQNNIMTPGATDVVKMRYRTGITTQMILDHGTRRLYIVAVRDLTGRRRSLFVECREPVS